MISFKAMAGGPGDYAPTIKKQAEEMSTALIKGDYKTYLKYTDPRIIKSMGGELAFIDTLKHYDAQRNRYGSRIFQMEVQEPTWVIDTSGELQTTVPVSTEIKVKGGMVTSLSSLIGISKDKGKTWVFMDTTEGMKSIRKKYKDISSQLPVPAPPPPTFQADN